MTDKPTQWVMWCINHNLKFLVYLVWFLAIPIYLLMYTGQAVTDAKEDFQFLKSLKEKK